jgi:Holliday junction resolvase
MNTSTFRKLSELHQRHGAREFGKICQKLLALAFRAAGCGHVVERGVQGVDIDAAWEGERYAAEIKTTKKWSVSLAKKDIAGLASRTKDGYRPLLGILRLAPLSNWILADASSVPRGNCPIDSLRPYRLPSLERRLCPLFDELVEVHAEPTLRGSQAYLDNIFQETGVTVLPSDSLESTYRRRGLPGLPRSLGEMEFIRSSERELQVRP